MAYLPAIGITPDSTCAAGALSTSGRMIHRCSKCASKEVISGSPRCQSSGLMRCSILHGCVGVLEENIGLVQAKNIVALLAEGEGAKSVILEIAKFGAQHHRVWGDGMTMLSLVARLGPCLGETTLVYALAAAARTVAGNCAGQPMRHSPGRLNGEGYDEERLSEWMFHWAKVRHDEAAERTLLTAVGCGLSREALNRLVFGPIQCPFPIWKCRT